MLKSLAYWGVVLEYTSTAFFALSSQKSLGLYGSIYFFDFIYINIIILYSKLFFNKIKYYMSYLKHYFCVTILLISLFTLSQSALAQSAGKETNTVERAENGVLFITGMLEDVVEKVAISGKEFSLNANGNAVLQVSLHESGRYAIALIKEYLPGTSDLVIQVDGYKDYIVNNLDELSDYVNMDIDLEPLKNEELSVKTNKNVDSMLNGSTSNPFILKF